MADTVLELREAALTLAGNAGPVEILRGITLEIERGESVGLVDGGLRLFPADGTPVTLDATARDGLVIAQLPPLPDGLYVLDDRVVSADGHPVNGSLSFRIGSGPPPVPAAPAGTPENRLKILEDAFMKALADPELAKEFAGMGMSINPGDMETAKKIFADESKLMLGIIDQAGIKHGDPPR